jgi:hypothetical protein
LNWAFIVNYGRLFLFEEIPEHCSNCKVVVTFAKLDLCKKFTIKTKIYTGTATAVAGSRKTRSTYMSTNSAFRELSFTHSCKPRLLENPQSG